MDLFPITIFFTRIAFLCLFALIGCSTTAPVTPEDYSKENISIRTQQVPDEIRWKRATQMRGLGEIKPLVPAFDGQGLLMASWSRSTNPDAPTFVIAHGGGGIGGMLLVMGEDLVTSLNANVLILDSIWSRGRKTNGGDSIQQSGRTLSSNARMFDLAAAGRWLSSQGVKPEKTFAIGESQGGWGVLRAFTDDPGIISLIKPYFAGGIALYPVCEEPGTKHTEANNFVFHRLGPYHSPVLLITGGRDTLTNISYCSDKTLKSASRWLHWEDVTHAFNIDTHGLFVASVDGTCKTMVNGFGTHQFCFNQRRTNEMMDEIRHFVKSR
jgi:predicted esterase